MQKYAKKAKLGKIGKFRQSKQNQAKQANLGKLWQTQAKLGIYLTNLLTITNSDARKEEKMKTEEDICTMAKNKNKKIKKQD